MISSTAWLVEMNLIKFVEGRTRFRVALVSMVIAALLGPWNIVALAQNYLTNAGAPYTAPDPTEIGFVETANGSLHIEIPLGSFPQRGSAPPLTIKAVYDSNIFRIVTGATPYWSPDNPSGGWKIVPNAYAFAQTLAKVNHSQSGDGCTNNNFTYTDASGNVKYFPIVTSNGGNGCPPLNEPVEGPAAWVE